MQKLVPVERDELPPSDCHLSHKQLRLLESLNESLTRRYENFANFLVLPEEDVVNHALLERSQLRERRLAQVEPVVLVARLSLIHI